MDNAMYHYHLEKRNLSFNSSCEMVSFACINCRNTDLKWEGASFEVLVFIRQPRLPVNKLRYHNCYIMAMQANLGVKVNN